MRPRTVCTIAVTSFVLFTINANAATCVTFAGPDVYLVGTSPRSVVTADFNRDGKPDVAVANSGTNNVSILLGNGDGTFAAAVDYGVGVFPSFIASADFNSDGKLDLVVSNRDDDNVSILLGSGSGTFGTAAAYAVGSGPLSIAIGDFNRDSKPDVAVASAGSSNVSILLGDGNGALTGRLDYNIGRALSFVAAGEFNGDGMLDLAVVDYGSAVSILPGLGNGTFDPALSAPIITGPVSVTVGDFNGDGNADLAVPTEVPATDDVAILIGNGDYTFKNAVYYATEKDPTLVSIADFDGDGKVDLAVANNSSAVSILIGNGDGTFSSPFNFAAGAKVFSATTADFDGDGKIDVAVGDIADNKLSILLNAGICYEQCGRFGTAVNYVLGTQPGSVTVGDINGDGKLDAVAVHNGAGNVSILLGNGTGSFTTVGTVSVGASAGPYGATIGDFDRDGKSDLAVTNIQAQSVSILLGDGAGNFSAPTNYPTFGQVTDLAIGDFNGDGMADLVVANFSSLRLILFIGNGDGTFDPPVTINTGSRPDGIVVADFNGDGRADIAATSNNFTGPSNNVVVLLGNGNGTFAPAVNYTVGANPVAIDAGDFNDDGKPDLAVTSQSNVISILIGSGTGTFATAVNYAAAKPYSVHVADFDGDGKADLAVTNYDSNEVSVIRGNGDGTFSNTVSYAVGIRPTAFGVGDLNADGKVDLLVANTNSFYLSILLNACPAAVDLRITKNHVGNFAEGNTGKTYTISVANVGGPATSGTVTVVDNLPAALTATAISGTGWTCTLTPTLGCDRTDPLAGGATYPPITLTVNVSSSAPGSVTNTATVSVAGDGNPANNTADDVTPIVQTPPAAPTNFTAIATSTTTVALSWTANPVATSYRIHRSFNNGPFVHVIDQPGTSYTDNSLTPGTTYIYRVFASNIVEGSSAPTRDLATTIIFTDDPLVVGTTVKAVHLSELRVAVNAVRVTAGLALATFTDTPAAGLAIKAVHVTELRSNLDAARSALVFPAITYTDPALATGTTIKAAHIQDLRTGVK